jgi:hypothetical protein
MNKVSLNILSDSFAWDRMRSRLKHTHEPSFIGFFPTHDLSILFRSLSIDLFQVPRVHQQIPEQENDIP